MAGTDGLSLEVVTLLFCGRADALDCARPRLLPPALSHGHDLLGELR